MSTDILFEILGEDERSRVDATVCHGHQTMKALGMHVGGVEFNTIMYTRKMVDNASNSEKSVYFVAGATRQMIRWVYLDPSLDKAVENSLTFFAHIWGIDTQELHDIVIKNHPW
jgi:hypothetical protein